MTGKHEQEAEKPEQAATEARKAEALRRRREILDTLLRVLRRET
jgi:hypothetical protein